MQIIHLTDDQMLDILTNIRVNQKYLPNGGNGYIFKPGSLALLREHEGKLLKVYRKAVNVRINSNQIVDGLENVGGYSDYEIKSYEPYEELEKLDLHLTEVPGIFVAYNGKYIGNIQKFFNGKMLHEIYNDPNTSLDSKIRFFRQVLEIIKEYESKEVINLDIKPDNYIVENGVVKPIDLGGKVVSGTNCISFLKKEDPNGQFREYREKRIASMYRHFLELMMNVDYNMIDAYRRMMDNVPESFLEKEYRKRRTIESKVPIFKDLSAGQADPKLFNYEESKKIIDEFEEHLRSR